MAVTINNRQGNDWGPQYQAALFPHDRSQERSAHEAIASVRSKLIARRALGGSSRPATMGTPGGTSAHDFSEIAPDATESPSSATAANTRGGVKEAGGMLQATTSSVFDEGEATVPVWWEGGEVRTVVIPTPENVFVPDASESEPAGE